MEKCIFVGYPSGYKGWQFYNPVTKKFIISERAIFDERSSPGPSRTSPVDLTPVGGHMNVPDALDSGGDNTFIPAAETARLNQNLHHSFPARSSTFQRICSRLLHLVRPQLNQTFLMLFRTLQTHHSSYSLFRRFQHLYQLQLTPLVLLDLLKALYSLFVALTALQSLQQSGGLSHLLQLVLHHLRPLLTQLQMMRSPNHLWMMIWRKCSLLVLYPPQTHTTTDRPFRLMILSVGRRLH